MSYSKKRLKMCVVYFTIFKIREYVKYKFKVTLRAIECLRNMIHIAYNAKYSNNYIIIQISVLKNAY